VLSTAGALAGASAGADDASEAVGAEGAGVSDGVSSAALAAAFFRVEVARGVRVVVVFVARGVVVRVEAARRRGLAAVVSASVEASLETASSVALLLTASLIAGAVFSVKVFSLLSIRFVRYIGASEL
jgi:O-succinylbenzoate synthase